MKIAKEVAQQFSTKDRPRFVAGSIGPTTKLPSLGLKPQDVGTEQGVKRQFVAAKAAGKLGELAQMLPKRP